MKCKNVAGTLLFIAGIVAIIGIITSEATYPSYSTAKNDISDLGATRPPSSIIKQPAATIFGATLVVAGLLLIGGAFCTYRAFGNSRSSGLLALFLGLFGVGAIGAASLTGARCSRFLPSQLGSSRYRGLFRGAFAISLHFSGARSHCVGRSRACHFISGR